MKRNEAHSLTLISNISLRKKLKAATFEWKRKNEPISHRCEIEYQRKDGSFHVIAMSSGRKHFSPRRAAALASATIANNNPVFDRFMKIALLRHTRLNQCTGAGLPDIANNILNHFHCVFFFHLSLIEDIRSTVMKKNAIFRKFFGKTQPLLGNYFFLVSLVSKGKKEKKTPCDLLGIVLFGKEEHSLLRMIGCHGITVYSGHLLGVGSKERRC